MAKVGSGRCVPVLLLALLASENVVVAAHKLAYQPEIVDSSNTVGYQVVCLHSDARAHHLAVKHGVLVVLHKDWLDEGADLEYVACEVGPLLYKPVPPAGIIEITQIKNY